MRLSKRVTACALAAVISVSLLVGCAGSGTKPNPGSSSSTSSSTSTKPDSGSNSNSSASSGSNANSNSSSNSNSNSSSSDATAEPTWAKSKSYKYGLILNGEKLELKTVWMVEKTGYLIEGNNIGAHFTRNGNKKYYMGMIDGEASKAVVLGEKAYALDYPEPKTCAEMSTEYFKRMTGVDRICIAERLKDIVGTTEPEHFKTGTGKVKGSSVVYETEMFNRTVSVGGIYNKNGQITCYYEGDSLKWVEFISGESYLLARVDLLTTTPNEKVLKLPDGYSITKWEDWALG